MRTLRARGVTLGVLLLLATSGNTAAQLPADAKALLSKPVTAGTLALLVEHGTAPEVQARVAEALTDARPETRAAAARVAFVLGMRSAATTLAAALDRETAAQAAAEQQRALAYLGGSEHDASLFRAWERAGEAAVLPMALVYATARGRAALAALDRLRTAGATLQAQREFLAISSGNDVGVLRGLVANALQAGNGPHLRAAFGAVERANGTLPEDLILSGLDPAMPAAIQVATLWHLLGYPQRPDRVRAAVATLTSGTAPSEPADALATIAWELGGRLAGRPLRTDAAWLTLIATRQPDLGEWFLRPGARSVLTVSEYEATPRTNPAPTPLGLASLFGPRGGGAGAPAATPPVTAGLRTAWGHPPGFMRSVFDAAGCDSARASTRASGGGGGTLTFRPNGTVASVALLDMGASRECDTAVRALLATFVADQAEMNQSRQSPPYATVIPFQPDFVGCENGQTPASAIPGGTPPKKIKDVKPSFPASAQRNGVGGLTVLEVEISEAGCIRRLTVLRSQDERLAWASIRAVSGWLFTPFIVDGRPAPVRMSVTTNFSPN